MHTCCENSLHTICCCLLFPCCACWAVHPCCGRSRSQAVVRMTALCLGFRNTCLAPKPTVTFLGVADIRGLWRQLALQTHTRTCRSCWSVPSHPALLRLLKRPLGQWVSNLPRKKKRRDTDCHQDWLHCKEVSECQCVDAEANVLMHMHPTVPITEHALCP